MSTLLVGNRLVYKIATVRWKQAQERQLTCTAYWEREEKKWCDFPTRSETRLANTQQLFTWRAETAADPQRDKTFILFIYCKPVNRLYSKEGNIVNPTCRLVGSICSRKQPGQSRAASLSPLRSCTLEWQVCCQDDTAALLTLSHGDQVGCCPASCSQILIGSSHSRETKRKGLVLRSVD